MIYYLRVQCLICITIVLERIKSKVIARDGRAATLKAGRRTELVRVLDVVPRGIQRGASIPSSTPLMFSPPSFTYTLM